MSHQSVATQTHWSWLKDLEEIARLKREHGGEVNLEMDSIQQMLDEEQSDRHPGASATITCTCSYTYSLAVVTFMYIFIANRSSYRR